MSDLYTEVLVKKQQTGKDKAIKGVLIFFTVLFAAAGIMMNPLILLLALVLGIVDYIFIPKLSVEFEYLYVNGELDIDRIYSQSRYPQPCTKKSIYGLTAFLFYVKLGDKSKRLKKKGRNENGYNYW